MSDTLPIPEHITPEAMYQMAPGDVEKMLEGIRKRRLSAVRQYEAALVAAKEASDEKARVSLMKQCDMLYNNLERVDKAISTLEDRVNKVRALRLELGLD